MKKVYILFLIIFFLRIDLYSQQNTNLLFHWEDTSLVGSSAYNNTYNEIWGLNIEIRLGDQINVCCCLFLLIVCKKI